MLHDSLSRELYEKGITDVHVWIPPKVKTFARRLMRSFGWRAPLWTDLTRETKT